MKAQEEPKERPLIDLVREPMIAGPIIGLLALGPIGNHVYHFNEESQLLCLFALFVGTVSTVFGDTARKYLLEQTDAILKEQNAAEMAVEDQISLTITAVEQQMASIQELKKVLEFKKSLVSDVLEARSQILRVKTHSHIQSLLDSVVLQEDNARAALKSRLIANATAHVEKAAASEALRKSSLEEALRLLGGAGDSSDTVGDLFLAYFTQESARMSAEADKVVCETSSDPEALFQQIRDLAVSEDLLQNEPEIKKLVQGYRSEPQTVGDQALLLSNSF